MDRDSLEPFARRLVPSGGTDDDYLAAGALERERLVPHPAVSRNGDVLDEQENGWAPACGAGRPGRRPQHAWTLSRAPIRTRRPFDETDEPGKLAEWLVSARYVRAQEGLDSRTDSEASPDAIVNGSLRVRSIPFKARKRPRS